MSFTKQLKQLLHPFIFVLKEGKKYPNDGLSYDLLMLQVSNEVIRAPSGSLERQAPAVKGKSTKPSFPRTQKRASKETKETEPVA